MKHGVRQSALSRLFGEFVVIVLGVLVALGVDEWRDDRAELRQESEYLASLVQDLERDIVQYEGTHEFMSRSIRGTDHVLATIDGREPADPLSSLTEAVRLSSWVNYPAWTSGTLDELVNSGSIRLIRDVELKRSILDYYDFVEEWKPRILGPEFRTFIEYRRYTAGWLPPSMDSFSRPEELPPDRAAALDAALLPRVRGNGDLRSLASGMREDWHGISLFMERFLRRAVALRAELESAIQAE